MRAAKESDRRVATVSTSATVATDQPSASLDFSNVVPLALFRIWRAHRLTCRPYAEIMLDARTGRIPGVWLTGGMFGFVTNRFSALGAMEEPAAAQCGRA